MLDDIYMSVLDMSKTSAIIIVFVLLARILLKKVPKVFSYALWGVVLFRLLCPVSVEAPVSIVPQITPTSRNYTLSDEPISFWGAGDAALQAVGDALNGGLGVQHIRTTQRDESGMSQYVTTDWWSVWILFGQYVWVAGLSGMVLYGAVSWVKLRKKLAVVIPLRENIFIADDIPSPFVIGLFRPKIYLPGHLEEGEHAYIILHEQHHIKRKDHVMKILAFIALSIHWFNPLVWLAFILSSRDMEMSCDEAVIRKLGPEIRADYSSSLLTFATGRRSIAGAPLAFGENNPKERIRNLANWKKPTVWIVTVSVILCVLLSICLMVNPERGMHLYEIDDSRNYSDLLQKRENILIRSFGEESAVTDTEGLLRALDEVKVGTTPIPNRSETRDSTHQIILDGHTYINFSWNYATVWIDNRVKPTYNYFVQNPLTVSRIFRTYGGNSPAEVLQELVLGTTYVPYQCIYMNPLSSYCAVGGDSGCKYIMTEDSFITVYRNDPNFVSVIHPELDSAGEGANNIIPVPKWEWQAFPYTDEEWAALYQPDGFGGTVNLHDDFESIYYQPLTAGKFLLNLDGNIWLVELSGDSQSGTKIWSIYSLVPESAMGTAQWEYAPMLSSRLPVFRVEFGMEYTSVLASCDAGILIPWDQPENDSGTFMTVPNGSALYWSPLNEEGMKVSSAKILFTVMNGDTPVFNGTLYLEGNNTSNGRGIYKASLVGTGLYLSPNPDTGGAVISMRNSREKAG